MSRLAMVIVLLFTGSVFAEPLVTSVRVPDHGIQPQAIRDSFGTLHLVYFKGTPAAGDLFYVTSVDDGQTWTKPVRVNSQPNSAIAIGTIRGAHMALGNHVYVAWNGSNVAEPKGPGGETPMLFTRLDPASMKFDPQRNVITSAWGLDGGGSITASGKNVYVAWHAPTAKGAGEASRRVMIARSPDSGVTWEPEHAAWDEPTGACGCCGLRIFASSAGDVFALYRSATETVHRDLYLLQSKDQATTFTGTKLSKVNVSKCVMSSASFAQESGDVYAAWETNQQVAWTRVGSGQVVLPPGDGVNRKYPSIAVNDKKQVLLAWAEETAWNKGGVVVWQLFDADGKPVPGQSFRATGLPTWSMPAAFWRRDGGFAVLY